MTYVQKKSPKAHQVNGVFHGVFNEDLAAVVAAGNILMSVTFDSQLRSLGCKWDIHEGSPPRTWRSHGRSHR